MAAMPKPDLPSRLAADLEEARRVLGDQRLAFFLHCEAHRGRA